MSRQVKVLVLAVLLAPGSSAAGAPQVVADVEGSQTPRAADTIGPELEVRTPRHNALVRSSHVIVSGTTGDAGSGLQSVDCNGAPATFDRHFFSCDVKLTPGTNRVVVIASDAAGNRVSRVFDVRFDDTLTVALPDEFTVPASSLVTIPAQVLRPDEQRPTYRWGQVAGPPVDLQWSDTPRVRFLTPEDDVRIRLSLTVTCGGVTATRETDVTVESLNTASGLTAGPGEAHDSSLKVAATSLRPGYAWAGPGTPLEVTLDAGDGVALDAANAAAPLTVWLRTGSADHDVSPLFEYAAVRRVLRLREGSAGPFRAFLDDTNAELEVGGVDSVGREVQLVVPLQFGRFRIAGRLAPLAGFQPAGTLVLLEGDAMRAATRADADGAFEFTGVLAGNYTVAAYRAGDVLGTAVARLRDKAPDADAVAVSVPISRP